MKFFLEFLLYYLGSKKLSQDIDYINFIKWFFIQIPYVLLMGIFSFYATKFEWKGR